MTIGQGELQQAYIEAAWAVDCPGYPAIAAADETARRVSDPEAPEVSASPHSSGHIGSNLVYHWPPSPQTVPRLARPLPTNDFSGALADNSMASITSASRVVLLVPQLAEAAVEARAQLELPPLEVWHQADVGGTAASPCGGLSSRGSPPRDHRAA